MGGEKPELADSAIGTPACRASAPVQPPGFDRGFRQRKPVRSAELRFGPSKWSVKEPELADSAIGAPACCASGRVPPPRSDAKFRTRGRRHRLRYLHHFGYAETSPVQSSVRPLSLEIVDKVQVAASDDSSKKFQTEVLPSVTKLVNEKLSETHKVDDSGYLLDTSKLKLQLKTGSASASWKAARCRTSSSARMERTVGRRPSRR